MGMEISNTRKTRRGIAIEYGQRGGAIAFRISRVSVSYLTGSTWRNGIDTRKITHVLQYIDARSRCPVSAWELAYSVSGAKSKVIMAAGICSRGWLYPRDSITRIMLAATSDMLVKLESSLIRPPDDRECANS